MGTLKLDRGRNFGAITPGWHGAITEQDGNYFGSDDKFMFSCANSDGKRSDKPAGAKGSAPVKVSKPLPPADKDDVEGEMDTNATPLAQLIAWAGGENLAFFTVKKMAKEVFPDAKASTADSIKELLVDAGHIDESDIK